MTEKTSFEYYALAQDKVRDDRKIRNYKRSYVLSLNYVISTAMTSRSKPEAGRRELTRCNLIFDRRQEGIILLPHDRYYNMRIKE